MSMVNKSKIRKLTLILCFIKNKMLKVSVGFRLVIHITFFVEAKVVFAMHSLIPMILRRL